MELIPIQCTRAVNTYNPSFEAFPIHNNNVGEKVLHIWHMGVVGRTFGSIELSEEWRGTH